MSVYRDTRRRPTWLSAALIVGGFVAVLWGLEILDSLASNRLDDEGIRPRDLDGLLGVLLAPVLHAGWDHLVSNTLPVVVLGYLVLASGIARGLAVTAVIWVVGGLGTWLIAPERTVHLGASGLIFGWLVYLILRGFFTHRAGQIIFGLVLFMLYGGALWGVLPGQPGISWQGHLFGAIGGGLAAWWLARNPAPGEAGMRTSR